MPPLDDKTATLSAHAERQRALNRESRPWSAEFAGHRSRVTELLGISSADQQLCVLGAGNCNDIDLAHLGKQYRRISLVDIDAESLNAALARQPEALRAVLSARAPIDILGLDFEVAKSGSDAPAVASAAGALAQTLGAASFQVVASCCVLSQLISSVVDRMGATHPRIWDAVRAVRASHCELLLDLLAPGGRGVLISDLVSSDTYPPLRTTPKAALPELMRQLVARRNFFTGLNPFAIEQMFRTDARLAPRVSEVCLTAPWLWHLGPRRTYLVFALTFVNRSSPA